MRVITIHTDKYMTSEVLGRLTSWNPDGFDIVDIYSDGATDFVACYSNKDTDSKYTIEAVWREASQEFTYHS